MIDGHNDLPWAMRLMYDLDLDAVDLGAHVPGVRTDIPRLRAGEVSGQFWSVYVPSTLRGPAAVETTLEQIEFVHRLAGRYPDDLALATSADEVEQAWALGRIASLIGMEGGHSIDESLEVLAMMYERGARYMTLTHNDNVAWADSATDDPALGGLSAFGLDVVREMNRLGMIVDLSHVSADVMRQALTVTRRPVMFSHSSARGVCDVPRNVADDVLAQLPVNGGICMVTFVPEFVSPAVAAWVAESVRLVVEAGGDPRDQKACRAMHAERAAASPPPVATVADVAAHVDHVREVAGLAHVGIGGDYDGTLMMPEQLQDVSGYPVLFQALAARGWSESELNQLRRANIMRVLRDNE